jgi:uncharacterized protein YxeA
MANSNSDSNNILRTILIVLIVVGIAYLIYYLYNQNTMVKNSVHMEEQNMNNTNNTNNMKVQRNTNSREMFENPININTSMKQNGVGEELMDTFSQDPKYMDQRNSASFPKDTLSADELLPQDNSSLWAQVNPAGEGSLKDRNFLQSGYHIGINTVGQTLRNANLQLRSEPPCPQVKVSPWVQSTIEPDVSRKPFEIGGCA